MNLVECINYFKDNYISFDLKSNNMLISINTEKNDEEFCCPECGEDIVVNDVDWD